MGFRELRRAGVLGMNGRNLRYIAPYNSRRFYPRVDDKLRTKILAQEAGIAVPELYAVIEFQWQVPHLSQFFEGRHDFVLKPVHGSGGNGILVIAGRRREWFIKASGAPLNLDALGHHVSNTLSGLYSLGGQPDRVLVEYRVKVAPQFESVSYGGVPDVRTLVFRGVPVMAMLRLPTSRSDGKANLHQGAVGAGIDLATGRTVRAIQGNNPVDEHPDTFAPLTGFEVPEWHRLLSLAASCYEISGLGYLGVDFVFDRDQGPMMLEMNARPGLSIQLANRAGLIHRLAVVEREADASWDTQTRVSFAQERFAA